MELRHTSQITPDFKNDVEAVSDRAAGGLVISKATGNILVAKRSDQVEHPNKMGIFGGRFDDFESPEEALEREIFEETGYPIFGTYQPLSIFHSPQDDFAYHTHIAFSPDDFSAELNWEHSEATWMTLDEVKAIPKEDLHHGIKALLDNSHVVKELESITQHYQQDLDKEQAVDQENQYSY